MRFFRRVFLSVAIVLASALLAGCPLLMIGGLGYSGYQYEKGEGPFNQPPFKDAKSDSQNKSKKTSSSSQSPPSDDVE